MSTETGVIVDGDVVKIVKHGAIIKLPEGKVGFLHISEIADKFVANIQDYFSEGERIRVKVLGLNRRDEFDVSYKQADNPAKAVAAGRPRIPERARPRVFSGLSAKPAPENFEDKLKLFLRASEEKQGELKRHLENKRGGRNRW